MNPQAFQIIETLGLRHPREYSVQEAIESKCNSFYLRYSKKLGGESRVIDKGELTIQRATMENDMSSGKLLKIEDTFDSVAGCAVYINSNGIYGEYVDGHIVALLRRGICKKRFFVDNDKHIFTKDAFQGFKAKQIRGGYIWEPCNGNTDKLDQIINYLSKNIISDQRDLLLEILITKSDIIVCDAKYPGMEASWQGIMDIFTDSICEHYIKHKEHDNIVEEKVKIDGFDVDFADVAKDILVANGALLSHYVTRNYVKYNSIKFI